METEKRISCEIFFSAPKLFWPKLWKKTTVIKIYTKSAYMFHFHSELSPFNTNPFLCYYTCRIASLIFLLPGNTSLTCSTCWHVTRTSRPSLIPTLFRKPHVNHWPILPFSSNPIARRGKNEAVNTKRGVWGQNQEWWKSRLPGN